jgi:hypothetical protein
MKDYSSEDASDVMVRSDFSMASDDHGSDEYVEGEDGQSADADHGYVELSENEVILKFSVTLMNKLRRSAFEEGIEIDELAGELINEGLAQRAAMDQQRGAPSHLMTRTGYVPPEANGNTHAQPFLSHHQNQGMPHRGGNNRRPPGGNNANGNNRRNNGQQRNGNRGNAVGGRPVNNNRQRGGR